LCARQERRIVVRDYVAPLLDMRFALEEVAGLDDIAAMEGFRAWDPQTAAGLLQDGARFFEDVWAPTNRPADVAGARLEAGRVIVHDSFQEVYRRTMDGGWNVLPRPPAAGRDGTPWLIHAPFIELGASGNGSLSMLTGLIAGAVELLETHASDSQQALYVPRLISGEWAGAMDLSEPGAGSDLGSLRTRAILQPDGTYRLYGSKRYISWGDHELTPNVVHLVLARTPDAPPGSAGISCFVVPKFLVAADGSLGARNHIRCLKVEQNMGFRASPTCIMALGDDGGAVGQLVGRESAGMRIMFTMMNSNRLATALGALGISERAFQAARTYARQRIQGRPQGATTDRPIIEHADVRRMLMTMRSLTEAMRAMCYYTAAAFDRAAYAPDAEVRARYRRLADLLTPIAKSWCTDMGNEVTSLAIQVLGGAGFVEESGVAQHYRDVRIMSIFEGTNGIQAQDLVGRKLWQDGGRAVDEMLAGMNRIAGALAAADEEQRQLGCALTGAVEALHKATEWMRSQGGGLPLEAAAGATAYQRLFGGVLAAHLLLHGAAVARRLQAGNRASAYPPAFLDSKVATAGFYCEQLLPFTIAAGAPAMAGASSMFRIAAAEL
jgi:alkylation response protein AidB-like acyl-CoA dehydrogenase